MLNLLKKKIALEIHSFYDRLQLLRLSDEATDLTNSAFCQSRQKLKTAFFRSAIHHFNQQFYTHNEGRVKLWWGQRLLAVDSSGLELPQSDALLEAYSVCCNQQGGAQPVGCCMMCSIR